MKRLILVLLVAIPIIAQSQSCGTTPGVFSSSPTISNITTSTLTISWPFVTNADKYRVFVKLNAGVFQFHSELNSNFQNFSSLIPGSNYTFFIEAVRFCVDGEGNPDETTRTSNSSSTYTLPLAPTLNEAGCVSSNPNSITFLWGEVTGAGYYFDLSASSTFSSYIEQNTTVTPSSSISVARSTLSPGTNYYYQLRAFNALGSTSAYSTRSSAIPTLPAVPTATAATAIGTTSFTANWQTTNGNATAYKLDVSTSPTFSTFLSGFNNLTVNNTSKLVDGLSPGSQYYYRVRAFTASATSANSVDIKVKTTPALKAPTGVVTNSFTANWDEGIGITGYQLDVSINDAFTSFVTGYNNLSVPGAVTVSTNITNLTAGSAYYYRVRAVNALGASANSATIMVITPPIAKPATNVTSTSITANWDEGASIAGYRLDVSTDNFTSFLQGYDNRIVTGNSLDITSLSPGTTYFYRVRSFNAGVSSLNSTTISQLTLPEIPQDFLTSDSQPSTIKVSWSPVLSATEFRLEVSSTESFTSVINGYDPKIVSPGTTNLVVTELAPATVYYFRIRSKNDTGLSGFSIVQSARTLNSDGKITEITLGAPQYASVHLTGQSEISIAASGGDGALTLNFYHRKNAEATFTQESVALAGAVHKITVSDNWFDSFGMEFYFEARDLANQVKKDNPRMVLSGISNVSVPVSSFGREFNNYQIISVPYALERTLIRDVLEKVMGTYDKKKWRFSQYQNGKIVDYEEGIGASNLEQGRGYWFISKNEVDLSFGQGKSFGNSLASPFKLQLRKGWNQIGNPFPYDLSWQDVLAANNNPSIISNLYVYDNVNVSFNESDLLRVYGGGFVFAEEATDVNFPVTLSAKSNGRIKSSSLPELELNHPEDWLLPIRLKQGEVVNTISGIGMLANAREGKDVYDKITAPRFVRYLEFNSHIEGYPAEVTRNISSPSSSKVWNYAIASNSNEPVELQWDSKLIEGLSGNLILYDESRHTIVNMAHVDNFLTSASAKISIYYDGKNNNEIESIVLGQPYPNPFHDKVSIPFDFSMSESQVRVLLQVFDSHGMLVTEQTVDQQSGQLKSIQWDGRANDGTEVQSGLYIYKLAGQRIGGEYFNLTGKIIKN